MIAVTSPNGHVKPEDGREILSAGPDGAFFCVVYGRRKTEPKPTEVKVFYTADYGRMLFRVESEVPEPKVSWWAWLTGRRKYNKCQRKTS